VDGRNFRLRWCESPLEARQLLIDESSSSDGLVLLTPLSDEDIGTDVLSTFPRGRLIAVDSSEMLCAAFQARHMDFRLRNKAWMADLLLDHAPPGGYPPVAGGVLDAETAWRHLLDHTLGLSEARPDAESLLQWTIEDGTIDRFSRLPANLKEEIAAWLAEVSGAAGSLIVSCVVSGHGIDALPLGLVCGVIFSERWTENELSAAAVRLENYVGRRRVELAIGQSWAEAATSFVGKLEYGVARPWLERADALLRELHVSAYASTSAVLPSSFGARLIAFARALESALDDRSEKALNNLESAGQAIAGHHFAKHEELRILRARMAMRLARWLARPALDASSFDSAAAMYASEGSYIDWARRVLMGGDENPTVSVAYSVIAERIRERRKEQNRAFAQFLKVWNGAPGSGAHTLPIETVLEKVIAPLAQKGGPVLVLVIDGLSYSVFRELAEQFETLGWIEMIPASQGSFLSAIAALPTLTEISRTSLFVGKLVQGNAQAEKVGFASHPVLVSASSRGKPPILYHKGELADTVGLSPEVRSSIADTGQRVVGIVLNAIDDQLDGSDQLHFSWSLEDIRVLRPILREARDAARTLILTSDHGHILEDGTNYRRAEGGDRWRSSGGAVSEDELELSGGRVLTPTGATGAVLPWGENLRFGAKKNGYHGGISPQEVVVPISVFSPALPIDGWKDAAPTTPIWWQERASAPDLAPIPAPAASSPTSKLREGTLPLFERVTDATPQADNWISRLIASSSYVAQKELASRGAPRDEDVQKILEALGSRGGKLTRIALAQKIEVPLVRLPGLLSAVKRILNIDQSPILKVEEATDAVELNVELLRVQFRLDQKR
jgi:hypothetical protein